MGWKSKYWYSSQWAFVLLLLGSGKFAMPHLCKEHHEVNAVSPDDHSQFLQHVSVVMFTLSPTRHFCLIFLSLKDLHTRSCFSNDTPIFPQKSQKLQLDLQLWENLKHWSFENQKCECNFFPIPLLKHSYRKSFALELQNMQAVFSLCPIRGKIFKQSMTFFSFSDIFKHKLWLISNSSVAGKCNLRNDIYKKSAPV